MTSPGGEGRPAPDRHLAGPGRTALLIARKDLLTEFRRFFEVFSILSFAAGSMLIAGIAARESGGDVAGLPAIVLWISLFFVTILIFTTSFTREADRGTLGGLKTLPCPPVAVLAGKVLSGTALVLLTGIVFVPFSVLFLSLDPAGGFPAFLVIYVLGATGLSFAGSFISGLVMFSEEKTMLLSFLLLPVCIPAIVPSVTATQKILEGANLSGVIPELRILVAFLLLVTAVMILTFSFVLEE